VGAVSRVQGKYLTLAEFPRQRWFPILRQACIGGHDTEQRLKAVLLQIFQRAEGADYGGGIALVGVDFGVEVAHFLGGDFVGEGGQGGAELGRFCEGGAADNGDGSIGREVMFVVN
jgi:hypothetical protein